MTFCFDFQSQCNVKTSKVFLHANPMNRVIPLYSRKLVIANLEDQIMNAACDILYKKHNVGKNCIRCVHCRNGF